MCSCIIGAFGRSGLTLPFLAYAGPIWYTVPYMFQHPPAVLVLSIHGPGQFLGF